MMRILHGPSLLTTALLFGCGPQPGAVHASSLEELATPEGETPYPVVADTHWISRLDVEEELLSAHTDVTLWVYSQDASAVVAYMKHEGLVIADGTTIPAGEWVKLEGALLYEPLRLLLDAAQGGHSLQLDVDVIFPSSNPDMYGYLEVDAAHRLYLDFTWGA